MRLWAGDHRTKGNQKQGADTARRSSLRLAGQLQVPADCITLCDVPAVCRYIAKRDAQTIQRSFISYYSSLCRHLMLVQLIKRLFARQHSLSNSTTNKQTNKNLAMTGGTLVRRCVKSV